MDKLNNESLLSQNIYFECLMRILSDGTYSRHNFLVNALRVFMDLTHSETGYIFKSDKIRNEFSLILSSGTDIESEGSLIRALAEYLYLKGDWFSYRTRNTFTN